jgi:predicted ester cyclase
MGLQESKSVVQEFYDQWNSGAIDFERLIHPEITNHQPDRDPETGLDKFRQAIEKVTSAVGTLSCVTTGAVALMREGSFRGIAGPRGKRFSVEHVHIYRITHNRIGEHWVVRDDLGMMLQTGAVSASG